MKNLDYVEMQAESVLSHYFIYMREKYGLQVAKEELAEVCFNATGRNADAFDTHGQILGEEDKDLKILANYCAKTLYELYLKYFDEKAATQKTLKWFSRVSGIKE